jgi:uncharacterized protein (TIGR02598 family)
MTRRGFSLAEVLFALAVGAVAVLTLIAVLIGGLRLLAKSQETSEATSVGRELMERIRARNYAHPLGTEEFDGRVPDAAVDGFPPAPYPRKQLKFIYSTRVRVRQLDSVRWHVAVDVFWNQNSSLQLETVLTR